MKAGQPDFDIDDDRIDPKHPNLFVELTLPDLPNTPTQKYRLTEKGRALLKELGQE